MSRMRTAEYVYNGKACKYGHTGARYKNGNCVQCLLDRSVNKQKDENFAERKRQLGLERYYLDVEVSREYQRRNREKNKDRINYSNRQKYLTDAVYKNKVLESADKYRKSNPEKVVETNRRYHERNREARNHKSTLYRLNNKQAILSKNRVASKLHYTNNKSYYWYKKQKRRTLIIKATPKWSDKQSMLIIKDKALLFSKILGIKLQVDHIVPLIGKNSYGEHIVCGLNCEYNLQLLEESINKSKNCRIWVDMP